MNSKILSDAVSDYFNNALEGGFLTLPGLDIYIKESTLNAPPLAQFIVSLPKGGNGALALARTWEYRDEIQSYQVKNNVSSIYWRSLNWGDIVIRFPTEAPYLVLMPQDKGILRRWKLPTVRKYLNFLESYGLMNLLVKEDPEGYLDNDLPSSPKDVILSAEVFDKAFLCGGSKQRVFCGDSKNLLYWLTEYRLFLEDFSEENSVSYAVKIRSDS